MWGMWSCESWCEVVSSDVIISEMFLIILLVYWFLLQVMVEAEGITKTAKALARLDVSTSLGLLAADRVSQPLCT